jgi:4-amino-4-deoxy-L-arabinose transferase-like glycosyltransferase
MSDFFRTKISRALCLVGGLLLAALAATLFFWNLGNSSVSVTSDEVIYVRITQGVIQNGDLFPVKHGSAASFEKPPLKFWLGSLVPVLLGESNWSYRAFDATLGILAVFLSAVLTLHLSRSIPASLIVGFLLLGAPEWVIAQHSFRHAVLDGLLTIFTLGMAIYSWRWCQTGGSDRNLSRAGILCALAILTKSVAGFVPLLCAVLTLVTCSDRKPTLRQLARLVLPPVITFLAYVVCVWTAGGMRGLNSFIGVEIFNRALSGFEGHNSDKPLYYGWYLFVRAAVAPRWILGAGVVGAIMGARRSPTFRFLLLWGALPVLAYSCSSSKAPWYLNPFMPFVCMIAVLGCVHVLQTIKRLPKMRAATAVLATLLVVTTARSYSRAVNRALGEVRSDTDRIPLDRMTEQLKRDFERFILVDNALSGRTTPIRGRFNVEGIYRGMLKPNLEVVKAPQGLTPLSRTAILLREESLSNLPVGWQEVQRIPPLGARKWWLVAVTYPELPPILDSVPHISK